MRNNNSVSGKVKNGANVDLNKAAKQYYLNAYLHTGISVYMYLEIFTNYDGTI